ncbi:fatty acid synthase subunit beta dehydratase [Metarhizium acridum CQMa 102]|uniref:Fatty acid synthase subunit beta dehydratase n=1 Tax=Metarhizium acridum (strain CQMa 102) TaxID=655827 RepID=E9DZ30_METAQ|nr:fatty acid synthase subunit beta dehydratase [Metarhizium acridum CQMa 102]EFY90992.1 fatty acid synthase subunit beta dehydratase [Metarhizium acridum CQMa 102]
MDVSAATTEPATPFWSSTDTATASENTDSSPSSLIVIDPSKGSKYITIENGDFNYGWNVPESHYGYLSRSKEQFLATISAGDEEETSLLSNVELASRFLLHLIEQDELDGGKTSLKAREECIETLLWRLETDFLRGADIHTFACQLPGNAKQRQVVIQAYTAAMVCTKRQYNRAELETALFPSSAGQTTNTYAIFGGQGNTLDYFGELRTVFKTYRPLVEGLLIVAEQTFQDLLANASTARAGQYYRGMAITQWLREPISTPDQDYLLSAPVSCPLIGLLQLVNFAVICRCLGKLPGDILHHLSGMTGHSQGVAVAAVLATVTAWDGFDAALVKALTILFHVGSAAQEATCQPTIPSSISAESVKNGMGFPSPMLNVVGCRLEQLETYITDLNSRLEPNQRVFIGLKNGLLNFVISGPVLSLYSLCSTLRKVKAAPGTDQSKIRFSARKPDFSYRFLPVSAPFHTSHLHRAQEAALQELDTLQLAASELKLPVYHSSSGIDIRTLKTQNIVPDLVRMILCELNDWPLSTAFTNATHVLDFGPGGLSGVGMILHRNQEGKGVRVIMAGLAEGKSTECGYRSEIFAKKATFSEDWSQVYSPSLIQPTTAKMQIENRMTRLLGLPPVMVAGMTPTTSSWEFVSAVMNSGYHVELAAGGFHNAEQLTTAIDSLIHSIPAGRGICVNIIYASPKQVRWQIPLLQRLCSEGFPIDGLTFGAGVPSVEVAREYMAMGFQYLSFKPGSAFDIDQVIAIARLDESYPILMQWTGGRGGGHHSFEDFHDPILKLYARVRRCPNIILLAGSGFGGAGDTYPYLSGTWSMSFGRPAMPFDGILLGSRMMVAKEAKTSRGCKEAIVAAPGVKDESSWEQSYKQPTGGIVTVKSEMGQPIHKIATRGVLFWKEMDDKIFSISDRPKRREKLREMRPYIIQKLNSDFQKVWFGRDDKGNSIDLEDMTYAQVLRRLVQLLYVAKESRWIDVSYMKLAADFSRRMYSRLLRSSPSIETDFGLRDPQKAVPNIISQCPKAETQVISYSDARYLVLLCKLPGQKPPPFLLDMDDDFEVWFKKDSLWQSEDLAAVVGEDAGRTCILQGPVAARYSTRIDEPVSEILDSINRGLISNIIKDRYGDDMACIPQSRASSTVPWTAPFTPRHCFIQYDGKKTRYHLAKSIGNEQLPDTEKWLQMIAGCSGTWLHTLLTSSIVSQGSKIVANPIRRALSPTKGMLVEVTETGNPEEAAITVFNVKAESALSSFSRPSLKIRKEKDILVTFYTHETVDRAIVSVTFKFTYHPEMPLHPIHEIMEGRNDRLRTLYYQLWFGADEADRCLSTHGKRRPSISCLQPCASSLRNTEPETPISLQAGFPSQLHCIERNTFLELSDASFGEAYLANFIFNNCSSTISSSAIQAFLNSIGHERHMASPCGLSEDTAPFDFAIVIAWKCMIKAIFPTAIHGDFMKLVHLSNEFKILVDSAPLRSLDRVNTKAEILAIRNEPAGRVVEVGAIIERDSMPVLEVISQFLFRGSYTDHGVCFEKKVEFKMYIILDTPAKITVLKNKQWFQLVDSGTDLLGNTIIFELKSLTRPGQDSNCRSVLTVGQVYREHAVTKARQIIANVHYQCGKTIGNQVIDYLEGHGSFVDVIKRKENPQPLGDQGSLRFTSPATNHDYACASGDFNPIHVSEPFSKYAKLPGTITHGMYTSAAVRRLVEKAAGANKNVRMRSYKCTFVDMVLPSTQLEVRVSHVATKNGLRVLSFHAISMITGHKVLVGEAEVDQQPSAYIFTGQGSQTPGMGMDLYTTSEIARGVWDSADKFFFETYGFMISDIVKRNPKQLTIHFGGQRGRKIRQNYMDMTTDCNGQSRPIFKSITATTAKYTFQHSAGLLYSTEFAQPALTILGNAQYLHLKSNGFVDPNAVFAGHSLGEYTALSAIGAIMPFEQILSVVFYRGLVMQSSVIRDANGCSHFSLMAINPSRIRQGLTTESLQALVSAIAAATGDLLELVNFNVAGQQYVAAGTLPALDCLTCVANYMATHPTELEPPSHLAKSAKLQAVIAMWAEGASKRPGPTQLKRGLATIPLKGIDVPFHSSFLRSEIDVFRSVLHSYIKPDAIDARRLVGKYCNTRGI